MKLVTSNEHKLKEFKRFGLENLEIQKGKDLEEVDSDMFTVCLYKALETGKGTITEDTSLEIEGEDIGVNIKWLQDSLYKFEGRKAKWSVVLGVNNGTSINLYLGEIKGHITARNHLEPVKFGFDSYFVPEGSEKTLSELEREGVKDNYSARKLSVLNYMSRKFDKTCYISEIPKWTGNMQKGEN